MHRRREQAERSRCADNLILLVKKIDDLGKDVVVPLLRVTETYDVDQKIAERAYRPTSWKRN